MRVATARVLLAAILLVAGWPADSISSTRDTLSTNRAREPIQNVLRAGGNVIVHRYTDATVAQTPRALPGSIDDGQRMSAEGARLIREIGATYCRLGIPVGSVLSSEYFFVYQHAVAAMGKPVTLSRDLTGSLYFTDERELEASLAALRRRVATKPPRGKNTVLFTHQGKFDLAFGIWLPPGQTVVFRPDGTAKPNMIANLSRERFVGLTRRGGACRRPASSAQSDGRASDVVRIPSGTYSVGSAAGPADERPAHRVRLAQFRIDRYEVTNAQFARFLDSLDVEPLRVRPAGRVREADLRGSDRRLLLEGPEGAPPPARFPLVALDDEHSRIALVRGRFVPQKGFGRHPVNEVTWYGARAFCAWRGARLPTEVEWEAAARGREGRTYPWGEATPSPARGVYGRASNDTAPVGSHPAGATPNGIHDLAGNVAEWTSSLYRAYPYDPGDGRENPKTVSERVTRGGDHVYTAPTDLRASFRTGFSRAIGRGHRHIGVRCAGR